MNVNEQLLNALKEIREFNAERVWSPKIGELCGKAIAAAEQAQRPCPYCDGTGDVHSITGEWRGVCSCEAGQEQQRAEPRCACGDSFTSEAVCANCLAAQQQAEPVAAQCRFEGEEEWSPCTLAHHLLVQAHPKEWPHYETRALYAQPPAVATDAITDAMEANAWRAALRGLCTGRELMTPDECAEHVRHRIESAKSCTQPPAVAVDVPDDGVRLADAAVCGIWDVFNGNEWFMTVTAPIGYDAKNVKDSLIVQRYAPHLNVAARHCVSAHANPVAALTEEVERLRAMLAAAPQAAVAVPDATGGKLRLLVAACNRIEEEAEEFEGPDGLEMGIAMDYWHEFAEALTAARKALAAAQKGGA